MKFSVIVPVYGVEKYLDECVQSILSQTYSDFELILVDDKSPDNCPVMCDAYAAQDARVRVIHKEVNEGLGFARNTGMAVAKGEYIVFVDSDDYISQKTLMECSVALTTDTDILVYGMRLCYENKKGKIVRCEELIPEVFSCEQFESKADMFARLTQSRSFQYACNKIYRREFLLSINARFERTKLIEDFLFNIEVFKTAKRIQSLSVAFYFYRKPTHETLASRYSPEFFDLAKRKYQLEKEFLQVFDSDKRYNDLIYKGYIKHFISAIIRNNSKSANLKRRRQKEMIRMMMDDSVTLEVVKAFVPQDRIYKFIRNMIVKKKATCMLQLCRLVAFIQ